MRIGMSRFKRLLLFVSCFSVCALSRSQELNPIPDGERIITLPLSSWNGFLENWTALKNSLETREARHQTLLRDYNLLLPMLEKSRETVDALNRRLAPLESKLRQSEADLETLASRIRLSGKQLEESNASLRKQTKLTASLEKRVKFYKTGFYITVGIGIAGIGSAVALLLLN